MPASRDELRALLRVVVADGRLVEFRVHEHNVERLYVFDFELARLFVDAPHSRHHVVRTCQQPRPVIAPVHRAHIGLDLHALRIRRRLNVGNLALGFAELRVGLATQIPQRRHVKVSPSDEEPLFGVELRGGDFEVFAVRLQPVDSLFGVVLQVFGDLLHESSALLHEHLGVLGACVGVLHHVALKLAELLELAGVDDGHGLLRLVRRGLLLEHLLLHLVLVVGCLVRLLLHHLLVEVSLVLVQSRVVRHHHALVLLAPAVERLHVLLLLLLGSGDEVRVRLPRGELLLLGIFLAQHVTALLLLGGAGGLLY